MRVDEVASEAHGPAAWGKAIRLRVVSSRLIWGLIFRRHGNNLTSNIVYRPHWLAGGVCTGSIRTNGVGKMMGEHKQSILPGECLDKNLMCGPGSIG